jgi:hypothetical protein
MLHIDVIEPNGDDCARADIRAAPTLSAAPKRAANPEFAMLHSRLPRRAAVFPHVKIEFQVADSQIPVAAVHLFQVQAVRILLVEWRPGFLRIGSNTITNSSNAPHLAQIPSRGSLAPRNCRSWVRLLHHNPPQLPIGGRCAMGWVLLVQS